MWDTILAIVTTVPAIAWFVNAFIKLGKEYKKNETKIKKVAKEGAEQLKETAKKVEEKVEKKLYDDDPEKDSNETKQAATNGSKQD